MNKRMMIGVCLAMLLLVSAVALRGIGPERVVLEQSSNRVQPETLINQSEVSSQVLPSSPSTTASQNNQPEADHLSQLSPEMRQAIKDKLILHGSMETRQNPDGSTSLPANGRFTQMPVAVQMPDGSIQVKEYSVIPDQK